MSISRENLEFALKTAFPAAKIIIKDLAGDNEHWSVELVDESFKGQSRLQQHKAVQAAVKGHDIHALQIKTSS